MKIPYSELEDEVRDGYYVDSLMKCAWRAQLNILENIDKICQKYNIQYQAEWGTLLGAVRHGGFIPWDDDMDISMKREDYNKFLEVAEKELPEGYALLNYCNEEEYWDVMTRVVNTKRYCQEYHFLEENCNFPFSTGIDIFPLDYLPKNVEFCENLKQLVLYVREVIEGYAAGTIQGRELERHLRKMEVDCKVKINKKKDLKKQLFDIWVDLFSSCREEDADQVALIPLWAKRGRDVFPKEYYSKTIRIPFAQSLIPAPIGYDSILKKKYGNYMRMVRKGGSHDYPYYKKQVETVQEHGLFLNEFNYLDVINREEVQKEKRKLNQDFLVVLEKVHKNIYKMLLGRKKEMAMQLLVRCQECAISVGEMVEKIIIEPQNVISLLEEYCELIFEMYQLIQNDENISPQGAYEILQEQLEYIKKEFLKEHKWKKRIVFVIDKVSRWNSLESIWKAAKEDKDSVVTVLVVPYAYKRPDGSIAEECYEGDEFSEYIEIEDYKTFNLEQYHPDVIYINNPYDEYNYLTTVHPNFYSSNLVRWCDKLIYIPWFVITELNREDERGWQSMQYFVTKPGVANADLVVVQSEKMKQSYVDYLTDWAGEETRKQWEDKVIGIGSPLLEKEQEIKMEKQIPYIWKEMLYNKEGRRKKVVVFSMSSSSVMDHKEKALDKLQRVLKMFEENREEICLIWWWDATTEKILRNNYHDLWKQFQIIVNEYKKQSWGILQEKNDLEFMAELSDAYYGDGSVLSQTMVMMGKKVMLQNYDC